MYMNMVDFLAEVPCYDNPSNSSEEESNDSATDRTPVVPGTSPESDASRLFNQEQVNKIVEERLARDRKSREEANKKLEKQLQDLLQGKQLSEQERDQLQSSLEDVQKQLRTKESQLAHEKQQMQADYEEKIKNSEQRAVDWEKRFRQSSISRALQDAAVQNDAYNANQIVNLLIPMTRLVETTDEKGNVTGSFEVVIDFPDIHPETGEPFTAKYTPAEGVKRMKELDEYMNLFKVNVVSGAGANNTAAGLASGSDGQIDVRKLTPEQYMKLRKEQPELFGFTK